MTRTRGAMWLLAVVAVLLASGSANGAQSHYFYDDLNRLIRVERADGIVTTYTYDAVGNRLSKRVIHDRDFDTVPDATDNCPDTPNQDQSDQNQNGAGDACDGCTGVGQCEDNDACTTDTCAGAQGCLHVPVVCDDGDPCTNDSCDRATGCVHAVSESCCSRRYVDEFERATLGVDWTSCANAAIVGGALEFQNSSGTPTNCPGQGDNFAQAELVAAGTALREGSVQFDLDNGGPSRANNFFRIGFGGHWVYVNQDTYDDTSCRRRVSLEGPLGQLAIVCGIIIDSGRYEFSVNGVGVRFRRVSGGTAIDLQAADTNQVSASSLVLSVNEDTTRVDNVVLTSGVSCDDGNPCTADRCDPGVGCTHVPTPGGACSDGDPCTTGDACNEAGHCVGGSAATCDDGDPCTADRCDPSAGCIHAPHSGGACDDGDLCTTDDTCDGGICVGGAQKSCEDGEVCTDDGCDPVRGCFHSPVSGRSCDDGNACTTNDRCNVGRCAGGALRSCGDDNPCTIDRCEPSSGCVQQAVTCDDHRTCTMDSCDRATSACVFRPDGCGSRITYSGTLAADVHDAASVSAVLVDPYANAPIAGRQVVFTLRGVDSCSGVTSASGIASCKVTPSGPAGVAEIRASFAGDASYGASVDRRSFTVRKEQTRLTYSGPTVASRLQPIVLRARLNEDDSAPAGAGRIVNFKLGTQICIGTTDGTGTAACTIVVNQTIGPKSLQVTFAGDASYLPSTVSAAVTVR